MDARPHYNRKDFKISWTAWVLSWIWFKVIQLVYAYGRKQWGSIINQNTEQRISVVRPMSEWIIKYQFNKIFPLLIRKQNAGKSHFGPNLSLLRPDLSWDLSSTGCYTLSQAAILCNNKENSKNGKLGKWQKTQLQAQFRVPPIFLWALPLLVVRNCSKLSSYAI